MPERNNQAETENYTVSNKQSVAKIQEAISRLKMKDDRKQGDMAQLETYPDRPGEPDCVYFLRTGSCGYGRNCRYNHPPYAAQTTDQLKDELPQRVGQPDCEYYLRTGTCRYGSRCKYHHPKDRNGAGPALFNALGLPIRQDEKPCPYYMRTGTCKYSVACKFHHPEPLFHGTLSPLSGPAAFGSTGSSAVLSMGLTYVGGYPTFSRTMYTSIPYIPGTQTHMPLIFSPSQGLGPAQGGDIYIGYNQARETKDGSRYDYNSVKIDRQEHQYIVNQEMEENKHEASGKYDKSIEKKLQPVTDVVGPHGLPSRPGQAECSYYNMYGFCNLGLGYRYDYPFHAYLPYIPPLYGPDPSHAAYPRVLPATVSSATLSSSPKHPDFVHTSASNKQLNADANTMMTNPTEQIGSSQPQSSQASSKPST